MRTAPDTKIEPVTWDLQPACDIARPRRRLVETKNNRQKTKEIGSS